jgi:thiol-disulfide isomerase/thioredoxin
MKTKFLTLFLSAFIIVSAFAQQGHRIHIKIPASQENTFFLAHYHGDKTYLIDTSTYITSEALFTDAKPLKQGIYILANSKKEKLAEFLVGAEQNFTIIFPPDFNPGQTQVAGSVENILFFEHLNRLSSTMSTLQEFNRKADSLPQNDPQRETIQKQIKAVQQGADAYRDRLIAENPNSLLTCILKAMKEPEVPEEIRDNRDLAYRYYKDNYWNFFDLSDDRLIRTPLLPRKLEQYMEQLVPPSPDSVVKAMDFLLGRARGAQEITDFLAWHFLSEYQQPKLMGMDKAFVYVADNYFLKGKVSGLTPSVREKIQERADRMRPTLLGNQAPDMWLIDTTGAYRSFRELKSEYIVIIFWDQTCSHCKKEMEDLFNLYKNKKTDFEVFAVNTTNDFDGWKHYLNEKKYPWLNVNGTKSFTPDFHQLYDIYSVPVIYILNRDRKIIGKRIAAQYIEQIIANSDI